MKDIPVWYQGSALIVCKETADALGLRDNQKIITEKHFWEILSMNASMMLCSVDANIQLLQDN